jgi:hypothetical protein
MEQQGAQRTENARADSARIWGLKLGLGCLWMTNGNVLGHSILTPANVKGGPALAVLSLVFVINNVLTMDDLAIQSETFLRSSFSFKRAALRLGVEVHAVVPSVRISLITSSGVKSVVGLE